MTTNMGAFYNCHTNCCQDMITNCQDKGLASGLNFTKYNIVYECCFNYNCSLVLMACWCVFVNQWALGVKHYPCYVPRALPHHTHRQTNINKHSHPTSNFHICFIIPHNLCVRAGGFTPVGGAIRHFHLLDPELHFAVSQPLYPDILIGHALF